MRPTFSPVRALAFAIVVTTSLMLGCEDDHGHGAGKPTGAVCPSPQTLTYQNFGMSFMDRYCQRCHASTVTGLARNGAPADHAFDELVDIRVFADHIDLKAGAGPAATNTSMPPGAPTPTGAERSQLSEWLACNAP